MTDKQINNQLIRDVKTAIGNVSKKYKGVFQVKQDDEGTDRISNVTFILKSSDWPKESKIKFSIDRPSDYLGEPDDPSYFACCEMGLTFDRYGTVAFAGTKYSFSVIIGRKLADVGKFVEDLFLPTSIEILKFAKTNSRKYRIDYSKFKKFFNEMWSGRVNEVPSQEEIASQLFKSSSEERNEKKKRDFERRISEWFRQNYRPYHTTSKQNKELKALVDGKNDKVFLKMLGDLGLNGADNAMKDAAKEILTKDATVFLEDSI